MIGPRIWPMVLLVVLASCDAQRGDEVASHDLPSHAMLSDLDQANARAATTHQPLILLVAELGHPASDEAARTLASAWTAVDGTSDGTAIAVICDLGVSRNRAVAARFHPTDAPLLLTLTPSGLVFSRDEVAMTGAVIRQRMREAIQGASAFDARLALLAEASRTHPDDPAALTTWTDALLAHRNDAETIAPLARFAADDRHATAPRIAAWVAVARAHLWIGEPEKSRHAALALIAALGAQDPVAQAGGTLILGLLDAKGLRTSLARKEYEDAIHAAPESLYAEQARAALALLPAGGR